MFKGIRPFQRRSYKKLYSSNIGGYFLSSFQRNNPSSACFFSLIGNVTVKNCIGSKIGQYPRRPGRGVQNFGFWDIQKIGIGPRLLSLQGDVLLDGTRNDFGRPGSGLQFESRYMECRLYRV